jgi:hypothetical protein
MVLRMNIFWYPSWDKYYSQTFKLSSLIWNCRSLFVCYLFIYFFHFIFMESENLENIFKLIHICCTMFTPCHSTAQVVHFRSFSVIFSIVLFVFIIKVTSIQLYSLLLWNTKENKPFFYKYEEDTWSNYLFLEKTTKKRWKKKVSRGKGMLYSFEWLSHINIDFTKSLSLWCWCYYCKIYKIESISKKFLETPSPNFFSLYTHIFVNLIHFHF